MPGGWATDRLKSMTKSCSFFVTKTGCFGLGPGYLEVDDAVYMLNGGTVPIVLRDPGRHNVPSLGERKCHLLIGYFYVHGIIDNRLKDEPRRTYL